jgi:Bacterial Ig domain
MHYAQSKAMHLAASIVTLVLLSLSTLTCSSYAAAPPIVNIVPGGCDPDQIVTPITTITSPANGSALHPSPKNIPITVAVTGIGLKLVSYYADGIFIGNVTAAPWGIAWANVPAGSHSIQAKSMVQVLQRGVVCGAIGPLSAPANITVLPNVVSLWHPRLMARLSSPLPALPYRQMQATATAL